MRFVTTTTLFVAAMFLGLASNFTSQPATFWLIVAGLGCLMAWANRILTRTDDE